MSIIGIFGEPQDATLRASMALHFKDCAYCRAILDGTHNVVKLVEDGKAFEIPASTTQKFYKKLNNHLGPQAQVALAINPLTGSRHVNA